MAHRKFVDLPIEHGDFPVRYVSLPEGKSVYWSNKAAIQVCSSHPICFGGSWARKPHQKRQGSKIQDPRQVTGIIYPIGSMYAIYGNIYHQYTPNVNVSIYTIHGSYGYIEIPKIELGNLDYEISIV